MSVASDVLVIGGGPAGTAAAIWAAQCGLRVVLLERTKFPRHRPGETLHPGAEPILKQLSVALEVVANAEVRHEGQTTVWAGRHSSAQFGSDSGGPWLGYQISRERLDAILIDRARCLGVRVLQPEAAVGRPIVSGGRVSGLMCSEPYLAKFVVDASGMRGFLRRTLGLAQMTASPPLRAHYGYGIGQSGQREVIPSLVGDEHGWVWTAKVGNRTFTWTRLDFEPDDCRSGLAPSLPGVEWHKPVRGADVTWRIVPACAGPGYFIAGDAAAVVDPASSHGVLRAMMSGIMAAHVVSNVLSRSVGESDGADHYKAWLSSWFEQDVRRLRAFYGSVTSSLAWADNRWASEGRIHRSGQSEVRRSDLVQRQAP
ncbi:FAD-dependent oxidoreductase [Mesorhizobium sp. M0698]|uniref:NAD(P)/FAD-dependent oxidoreductase n=1 Tax=Mesorhizobium sp. M0698 TaxID=2956987 RepID=UPI00333AD75E